MSCLHVCMCTCEAGSHKRHWIPWGWGYRPLWAITWVLWTNQGPLQEHQALVTAWPSLQPQVVQISLLWSPCGFQGGKVSDENVYLAIVWMPFSKMAVVIIILLFLFEWVAWLPPVSYRGWLNWMMARRAQQASPGRDNSALPWSPVLSSVSAWHRKHPISE